MTNAGFLLPDPGFHEGLREVSRRHGTLLGIDETHTLVTAYGGLTTQWALELDLLTVGKSIAGGAGENGHPNTWDSLSPATTSVLPDAQYAFERVEVLLGGVRQAVQVLLRCLDLRVSHAIMTPLSSAPPARSQGAWAYRRSCMRITKSIFAFSTAGSHTRVRTCCGTRVCPPRSAPRGLGRGKDQIVAIKAELADPRGQRIEQRLPHS